MPPVNDKIVNFMKFQRQHFDYLLQIQVNKVSQKIDSVDNDYRIKPEGQLVFLNCGHRGQPSRTEEKRISRLLRKSLFIPLLEDMPSQTEIQKVKDKPTKIDKSVLLIKQESSNTNLSVS